MTIELNTPERPQLPPSNERALSFSPIREGKKMTRTYYLEAGELYNRLSETDNMTESADWIGAGDLFDADGNFNRDADGTWYVVSWPQHVVTARYNGDCQCTGPFASREEATEHAPQAIVHA